MNREELRDKFSEDICNLCRKVYFTQRAHPEDICEGRWCEDAEYEYADNNGIELED